MVLLCALRGHGCYEGGDIDGQVHVLVGDRSSSGSRGGISIKVIRCRTWDDGSTNAKAWRVGFLRVVVRTVT